MHGARPSPGCGRTARPGCQAQTVEGCFLLRRTQRVFHCRPKELNRTGCRQHHSPPDHAPFPPCLTTDIYMQLCRQNPFSILPWSAPVCSILFPSCSLPIRFRKWSPLPAKVVAARSAGGGGGGRDGRRDYDRGDFYCPPVGDASAGVAPPYGRLAVVWGGRPSPQLPRGISKITHLVALIPVIV